MEADEKQGKALCERSCRRRAKEVWGPVFEAVSGFTSVLAYDRAGYGKSRTSASVRDGATVVAELRSLLRALELPSPYVLVGHSLGGQFVVSFARSYPEEVAGVVLVDARHVEFGDRCEREGVERCTLPLLSRVLMPRAALRELDAATQTESQIRAAGPFADLATRAPSR